MAQHVWTVLCDKVLQDSESPATASLVQVVERLTLRAQRDINELIQEAQTAGDKGIILKSDIKLVSWWVRSDYSIAERSHFKYALVNPAGIRVDEHVFPLNLVDSVGYRMVVRIADFPLSGLGLHWILIEEDRSEAGSEPIWSAVARIPLEVVEEQRPVPTASSEPPPPSEPTPDAPPAST